MDADSRRFKEYLRAGDLAGLRTVPKADLHNHFVLGGSRDHIERSTGVRVPPVDHVLTSMDEMHAWFGKHLGDRFDSTRMRLLLLEATLVQARDDGVTVLEVGEDVWGLGRYFDGDVDVLLDAVEEIRSTVAPGITLRQQIGLSRHCAVEDLERWLEPFWGRPELFSIDLSGDESAQPIERFAGIYARAAEHGLRRKAHVGEWGSAQDVVDAVTLLDLDEVQHGIAAASSPEAVDILLARGTRLNLTVTSNELLGRVHPDAVHPIQSLHRAGVDVTIGSDDVLIFDSDVSGEYLRLARSQTLTVDELDDIRINGLRDLGAARV